MPNATVAEYGTYTFLTDPSGIVHKIQAEIYARGPIATGVVSMLKLEQNLLRSVAFAHLICSIFTPKERRTFGRVHWRTG